MQILFDYPWYFVPLCLALGLLYAGVLYFVRRRPSDNTDSVPLAARILMPLCRFVTVSLIALLLLAPMMRRTINSHEKPILLIAEDASESVTAHGYAIPEDTWNPLLRTLEKDFDVVRYSYGAELAPYGDTSRPGLYNSTDISTTLTQIKELYSGRNLAAIVLTGDGIYNQGQNPTSMAGTLPVPIYTVAQGDTTRHQDAAIASVRFNRIAYLGNQFPLEITLRASRLNGHQGTLTIRNNGKQLFSQSVNYTSDNFSTTVPVTLDADKAGLQSYTITLSPDPKEQFTGNNTRTIAIEVIDGHQKIAILACSPHPDISALRKAIEHNPNYTVDLYLPTQLNGIDESRFNSYNLLIFHNLPSPIASNLSPLVSHLASHLPTLFVVGTQTDLPRFNNMHLGLEIATHTQNVDEASALYNKGFSLFNLNDNLNKTIEQLPPLQSPFGNYQLAGNYQALFHALIGGVNSSRPLIAFGQNGGVRRAFITGEGLWRWRLHCYHNNGSHDDFDELISKIIVYTSLQVNKERFRVTSQSVYGANEPVLIEAELYNDAYEPVNTPEVQLTLSSPNRPAVSYSFNRYGNGYQLPLGLLGAGVYTYTATTTFNGKKYTATGTFIVEEYNLEEISTVADHSLLNTIASTTGGAMLEPGQLDSLPELLAERDDIKSVIYSHTTYTDLLHLPLILILLILLLTVEWALRKYYL